MRPQLDYGDIIYHIPAKISEASQNTFLPNLIEKIRFVLYSTALAMTSTWRRTSRQKLYAELGRESLTSHRWSRRLTLFYKIVNNLVSGYVKDPITQRHYSHYSLRNQDVAGRIVARAEKFKSSKHPRCLWEWTDGRWI